MADKRFSTPGKPATEFEHGLLENSDALEDPWCDIARVIGLDNTLLVMDRFAHCQLSCPSRDAFVQRLHRVWQDVETQRLLQLRPRLTMREIAGRIGVTRECLRKRRARALKRVPPRRA